MVNSVQILQMCTKLKNVDLGAFPLTQRKKKKKKTKTKKI